MFILKIIALIGVIWFGATHRGDIYQLGTTAVVRVQEWSQRQYATLVSDGTATITPGPLKKISTFLSGEVTTPLTVEGIVAATNTARQAEKLPLLVVNTALTVSAQKKAEDMLARQYFEHASPDGVNVDGLAQDAGYAYITVGENLALGNFENDIAVVTAWLESPGHRANIVHTGYQEIGIGIISGIYEGKKVWLAVQHFGIPLSVCPVVSAQLRTDIEREQSALDQLKYEVDEAQKAIRVGDLSNAPHALRTYNTLAATYNERVRLLRSRTVQYNTQVQTFNACVSKFSTSTQGTTF